MKHLIYILLISIIINAKQTEFPLKYSIENDALFLNQTALYITEKEKLGSFFISLMTFDDEYIALHNDVLPRFICNETFTFDEYMHNKIKFSNARCNELYHKQFVHKIKTLNTKDVKIILFQNGHQNYSAILFDNNHCIGSIDTNMKLANFESLLQTIKKYAHKSYINYLNDCDSSIKKANIQNAMRSYISMYLLNSTHIDTTKLKKKLDTLLNMHRKQKLVIENNI